MANKCYGKPDHDIGNRKQALRWLKGASGKSRSRKKRREARHAEQRQAFSPHPTGSSWTS